MTTPKDAREALANERERLDRDWPERVDKMRKLWQAEAIAAERARITAAVEGLTWRDAHDALVRAGTLPKLDWLAAAEVTTGLRAAVLRIIEEGS